MFTEYILLHVLLYSIDEVGLYQLVRGIATGTPSKERMSNHFPTIPSAISIDLSESGWRPQGKYTGIASDMVQLRMNSNITRSSAQLANAVLRRQLE